MDSSQFIDRLGGTKSVAVLCKVKEPSVSYWRRAGIPDYRVDFLQLARPEAFAGMSEEEIAGLSKPPSPHTLDTRT